MIVNLHKYLVVGSPSEMDRFFISAQKAGFMEFIGLSHKRALEMPDDAKTILSAIKILKVHFPKEETYHPTLPPLELAQNVVALNDEYEKLLEEERILNGEIARVAPFGDFSRDELDLLQKGSKRVFQFFCMRSESAKKNPPPKDLIYITTEYDLDYFFAINKETTHYPKMTEITIERAVGELRERLSQVIVDLTEVEKKIHTLAISIGYLQKGLAEFLNHYDLEKSKHDTNHILGDSLLAIEAWVPETRIKALFSLLGGLDVYVEEIAIENRDRVPTCMENKGKSKIGEDLVNVYDTPAPSDKDPSLWILIFFSIFFAIIVADGGYGLVYLCGGLLLKWKIKRPSPFMQRFTKLILISSTCCIIWGVLTVSFFGIQIGPNNPLRKVSLLHNMARKKAEYHLKQKDDVYQEYVRQFPAIKTAKDGHEFLVKSSQIIDGKLKYKALVDFYDSILLEFSLFIGLIHISLSFIRYLDRNLGGIAWIIFMVGGYLFFPSFVDATSFINYLGWISKGNAYVIGEQMVYIGLVLVFIIALLQKKKWGAFHELTNAVQVFADVLSYLRLYALALAGMIMAETFNDLAMDIGVFGGFFIILIGHTVNLTLTTMSGVIHGLRLNFLEWYHYSFEGGGRLFNPLRIRK